MINPTTFFALAVFGMSVCNVQATEYFVSRDGDDQANGHTRATALATIQKGVDALQPGDTLTIAPGEYRESVRRENLGSEQADTTIRAEVPGTVLLRGDLSVDGFAKVDGYRFVYAAPFEHRPYAVAEADSLALMNEAVYLAELEFLPGTYLYDAAAKMLYISSSDLRSPLKHHYRASVMPRHGLDLQSPTRVIIDGIAATGYNFNEARPFKQDFATTRGIHLEAATRCTIRRCTAYLNGGGISILGPGGGHNLIEDCTAYANNTRFNQEGGNITIYRGGPNDVIRRTYVYRSATHGQRFYLRGEGPLLMEEGVGWGNRGNFWIKVGNTKPASAQRMVDLGRAPARDFEHCIVGQTTSAAMVDENPTSIFLDKEADLDPDAEFADPAHFDYRLQKNSRFIGAAPDGSDRGPFQYQPDIYYLRPDGNDQNEGLSVAAAWRTFARAWRTLKPGDTLYIQGGVYPEDVNTSARGVTIQRRGREPVVLAGDWVLDDAKQLTLQRLTFTGSLSLREGEAVKLTNCAFVEDGAMSASNVSGLRITHGVHARSLRLADCSGVYLSGNLYAATPAVEWSGSAKGVLFSDYNSYPHPHASWRSDHDRHSIVAKPGIEFANGRVRLADAHRFAGVGPLGTAIGLYFEGEPRQLNVVGPFVQSVSDTTADLEWWTAYPAVVELSWGATPACEQSRTFHYHNYGGYSLTGLEPGQTYHYRLRLIEPLPVLAFGDWIEFDPDQVITGTFTTTMSAPTPRTLYVAPDGDDDNSGLTYSTAWRSLNHAASQVRPGDTVLVAGGTYEQTVWLRATGDKDRPITFRGMPGHRVTIDGGKRRLFAAFVGNGKHHVVLDSFYGVNLGRIGGHDGAILAVDQGGMFVLSYCDNVLVQRCFKDGRGPGYSPSFMVADGCDSLTLRNNVEIRGFNGPRIINSPNLRVENNVFFYNLICQLSIINHSDQPALVANNIFTDGLPKKFQAPMITVARVGSLTERDNCYYARELSRDKHIVTLYGDEAFDRARVGRMMGPAREEYPVFEQLLSVKLAEMPRFYGPNHSIIADPQFAGLKDVPARHESGAVIYPPDRLRDRQVDFNDFFATNPTVVERGMGLDPAAFANFNFDSDESDQTGR